MAAAFPGWPMVSLAYPTTDHVMPFKLFALLAQDLPRRWAAQRWQDMRAARAAIVSAFGGASAETRVADEQLLDEAFPQPPGAVKELPPLFPTPE